MPRPWHHGGALAYQGRQRASALLEPLPTYIVFESLLLTRVPLLYAVTRVQKA
jgi:hypothetical protein